MKFIILSALLLSSFAWAKEPRKNFNKALMEDVKSDIRKDEDKFRVRPSRGPASVVPEVVPIPHKESPIEKKDRIIGPERW